MSRIKKFIEENLSFILILLLTIIFIFFRATNDNVIYLKGDYLFYGLYLIIVLISLAFIYWKKRFGKSPLLNAIMLSIFIGALFIELIYIPLDYYNINSYSTQNQTQTIDCPLLSISKSRRSRGIYISFMDKQIFIRGHKAIFNDFENGNKNLADYVMAVTYREGWLNSFVLLDNEIKKKTQ